MATSLLGEQHPQRLEWMADHTLKILSGQTQQVITSFQEMAHDKQYTAPQCAQLEKTATYFQRNLPYMAYNTYLERGWPIASGVIEGQYPLVAARDDWASTGAYPYKDGELWDFSLHSE